MRRRHGSVAGVLVVGASVGHRSGPSAVEAPAGPGPWRWRPAASSWWKRRRAEIRAAGGDGAGVALRRDRRGRLRGGGWSTEARPRGWAASTWSLYMSGSSPVVRVAYAPASLWHEMLATNLVGAAVVVRAALESLRLAEDPVVVVATHSMGNPWPWLGVYGTTKAALAEMAKGLRRRGVRPAGPVRGGRQHGHVVRRQLGPRGRRRLAFEQWAAGPCCATTCCSARRWPTPSWPPCSIPTQPTTTCSSPGAEGVDSDAPMATSRPTVRSIFSMAVRGSSSVTTIASGSL